MRDGAAAVERVAAGRVTRHEVIASVERQVLAVRLETDDPDGLRVNLSFATQADTRFALRWRDRAGEQRSRRLTPAAGERVTAI